MFATGRHSCHNVCGYRCNHLGRVREHFANTFDDGYDVDPAPTKNHPTEARFVMMLTLEGSRFSPLRGIDNHIGSHKRLAEALSFSIVEKTIHKRSSCCGQYDLLLSTPLPHDVLHKQYETPPTTLINFCYSPVVTNYIT